MSVGTTVYPAALDSNAVKGSSDEVTSTDQNDRAVQIEALQVKVGIDSSADTDSIDYKVAQLRTDVDSKTTVAAVVGAIYPVGSIYISTLSTNPGTLLGVGTWAVFGAGKVMVGLNSSDTDFDTAEETGGAKTHTLSTAELAVHTHTQNSHNHTQNQHRHTLYDYSTLTPSRNFASGGIDCGLSTPANPSAYTTPTNVATTATNNNAGSGSAHNNLQPYIVVYSWKRTA